MPALIEPFLEEVLRLEAPAQGLPRFPTMNVELHGVTVPAGSTVFVLHGSANHDETVFADPDDLVLDRRTRGNHKQHLASDWDRTSALAHDWHAPWGGWPWSDCSRG